jgi:hypothetical protein
MMAAVPIYSSAGNANRAIEGNIVVSGEQLKSGGAGDRTRTSLQRPNLLNLAGCSSNLNLTRALLERVVRTQFWTQQSTKRPPCSWLN